MTLLSLNKLTVKRADRTVVDAASFDVEAGEVVGLIGPNGAGKTTLMRAALGLIEATGDSSLARMDRSARAKAVSWMPQEREIAWPISVHSLVLLGRLPHGGGVSQGTEEDAKAVSKALKKLDLEALKDRPATELSGGEKARVLLARAIAQEAPLVMADEPTAGLDPGHQVSAMKAFQSLAAEGRGVIISLHDLGLAVRHTTRLILLDEGKIVADDAPREVLAPQRLESVFGIRARMEMTDDGPVFQTLDVLG